MKKIVHFFVFIFGLVSSLNAQVKQPAPPEPNYEVRLAEADSLYSLGSYEKVIALLKDFPAADTAYATALDQLSLAYLSVDNWEAAIESAKKGLTLRSQYKRHFYEILGAAYDENKEYTKAFETFTKGFEEFPTYTRFWYHLGLNCIYSKKYVEAEMYLRKAIQTNPFYSNAHLKLGLLMYNSNRMIPAMLSYQLFLMLDDASASSVSVLREYERMGNGEYKSNPDSLWLKMPDNKDNFQELEAIVKSKFALNEKYKTNVKLKYTTLVKTMQIVSEKIEFNKADTGFYMQFYVPFFMEMKQANETETAIYYCLRSIEDENVAKELKKQSGAIEKMATHLNKYLSGYRQMEWKKLNLSKYDTWFTNAGHLGSEGNYDEKTKMYSGEYSYYWQCNNPKTKGVLNSEGKSIGKWEYFYPEGELQAIKYFKNDLMFDSAIYYFADGGISEITYFNNDKRNGSSRLFFSTGGLRNSVTYVNGEMNGPVVYYHENGFKKLEATLVKDKLNGHFVEYYDNGTKLGESEYVDGLSNGHANQWYANGKLKSEGAYLNGEQSGEWKYYSDEGFLNSIGSFKGGKEEGLWKTLNRDGSISTEIKYVGGKIDGDVNYYEDSVLWSVLTFSKDQIKKYKYYDKDKKVISEGAEKNGTLKLNSFYLSGAKLRERTYINGNSQGKCTTWYENGNLKSVENYKDDELDGMQTYYNKSGKMYSEYQYKKGNADGYAVEYYTNGVISTQGWFVNDVKRGEWIKYSPNGIITESNYYQNNELQGPSIDYDVTGKMEAAFMFSEGQVIGYHDYDTLGVVCNIQELKHGNGTINGIHLNKKPKSSNIYKFGSLDGEIKRWYANGKERSIIIYANGNANGAFKKYTWDGKKDDMGFYKDGYLDSTRTTYLNDKPYMNATYTRGDFVGERSWLYPNGKVSSKGSFINDDQDGYFYYFADNGMLRYRLLYKDDEVVSYSYLNADSTFKPEIPLKNSTGEVKAFYQNGNPSVLFTYKSGYYDGPFIHYHPNGKVRKESNYVMHEKEGIQKEYNDAGQLTVEENYSYDMLNGICKYYNNGVIQRESAYIMDSYHGPTKIYDKSGKLVKTVKMYNDEPYE